MTAQEARLDPNSITNAPPLPRLARDVEVYHGTVKVWPPARSAPTPTAAVRVWPVGIANPSRPSVPAIPAEVRREPLSITTTYCFAASQPGSLATTAPWLGIAPTPLLPAGAFSPPIPPVPAQLTPAELAGTATRQQDLATLHVRELTPNSGPVMEPTRGVTIGLETLMGIGVGLLGVGYGYFNWRRRPEVGTPTVIASTPVAPTPVAPEAGSIVLLGQYNAGPPREAAERFEIGPAYEAVVREKKKTEEQKQQAVLEFILSQNLALHAAGSEG